MLRSLLAALAVLTLAACGREAEAPAQKAGVSGEPQVLNLYSARHYDADEQLYDGFERQTGIRIRRIENTGPLLIERMKAEGADSPADVLLMADAGALWRAQAAGLLQPVRSPVLEQRIPAHLREAEGRWFGFARRARIIAYDKASVPATQVATYAALAEPRFKGQVCVRDSANIYNLSTLAALIEKWGRDRAAAWARGVVANMARPPQGGDIDQIRAVAAGACKVALANSYYYLRLVNSQDPADRAVVEKVGMVFPEQAGAGALVNISGGGVAAHAPNRAAAVRFLEYLASDEAQSILAGANNEFPAVQGARPPESVAAYTNFKADPLPVTVYGRRQAEAQAVFDEAGWR
jgi:iron(III) transport system substrate-binding protein